jgi:drug/metabolite transporter (DMT)-like permease
MMGGILGPVLLMLGLTRTDASTAALLLNLEGLAAMGIAWILFHEPVDKRLLIGAGAILAGALLLSWQGDSAAFGWGALAIAGACVAWGFDNNLTRKLSSVDPVQIATVKGLVAGAVNVALAIVHGTTLPALSSLTGAGLVGLFGYGASLVLFVLALRYLGTARTAGLLFLRPVHRCDALRVNAPGADHGAPDHCGIAHGGRRLPASVRSTRARARA